MDQEFTVLENKTIGRNLYKFRALREKKAAEIADFIGISESAYTKYERGESKITVDIIQKVAECLQIDPLQIIASTPGHIISNVHDSPFAINGTVTTTDEKQTALITRLIETQISMNQEIIALLKNK